MLTWLSRMCSNVTAVIGGVQGRGMSMSKAIEGHMGSEMGGDLSQQGLG